MKLASDFALESGSCSANTTVCEPLYVYCGFPVKTDRPYVMLTIDSMEVYCRMALSVSQIHWDYFILLEDDVNRILRYLEPVEKNFNAFGSELVKAYLSICSEIDVAFKDFDQLVRSNESVGWRKVKDIAGSRKMVYSRFSEQFQNCWVAIMGSEIVINPWSAWWSDNGLQSDKNPCWWISYNDVKHHRLECYSEACLGNVLHALSGLFVLLSCIYRYEFEKNKDSAPSYLEAPSRLYFSKRGIEIGSSEPLYVIGKTLCSSRGFHVDQPL